MFEWFIVFRYLVPRRKNLSRSLISILSLFVISIVVWLTLVFLSVTSGIEKKWIKKLVSLNAPLQLLPTEKYFSSYYYLVDSISSGSEFETKTIEEKAKAPLTDPYQKDIDPQIPIYWPKPYKTEEGKTVDLVKQMYSVLKEMQTQYPDFVYEDFELDGSLIRVFADAMQDPTKTTFVSQMTYLLSLSEKNPLLDELILEPNSKELLKTLEQDKDKIGVILPKQYKRHNIHIGNKGYFSYQTPNATSSVEQRLSFYVAGFYDPGVLPIGYRVVLVPKSVTKIINNPVSHDINTHSNGVFIWFKDFSKTKQIQQHLIEKLKEKNLLDFWKTANFYEYEFSKDLMQQFQSDRLLFTLIALIILIVACSNIVSMLILLVNEKKKEIAILQAMGANRKNIMMIFGLCGVIMGIIGSLTGTVLAFFTLQNLDILIALLSKIQGHAAFNTAFFGETLPNKLSMDAFWFIIITTPILSLIAGLIPAFKASRLKPSEILRGE